MSDQQRSPYERIKISKGRRVFHEGDSGDYAYIVETGEIGILKNVDGREIEINTLFAGEIFGEIAVLDGRERMASAVALQDTVLLRVSQRTLEERVGKTDPFVRTLLNIFMSNLRDTHATYNQYRRTYQAHIAALRRNTHNLREMVFSMESAQLNNICGEELKKIREAIDVLESKKDDFEALAAAQRERQKQDEL